MQTIKIETYQQGQETLVFELIKKVYDEFVAIDYSCEGNDFFYQFIAPDKITARQQKQLCMWLAFAGENLVGMIELRDDKYISLLFVDKNYHGQGIARKLFAVALNDVLKRQAQTKKFYVHASPFSIPVYEKLGFHKTDEMLEENGIKYLPMEIDL